MALIEAAESAPSTIVATVEKAERIDTHGYTAVLRVERSLKGPVEGESQLRIAWEELASARTSRFRSGERILVSLERLSGASIWRQRFPDPSVRSALLGVAMKGDAFLRQPGQGTLGLLEHYLALSEADRAGEAGVSYLVDLALIAELPMAEDAASQLATRPQLEAKMGARSGGKLVDAMLRPDASESLGHAIVSLIGSRRLESTRPSLEAMTRRQPPPPPIVFAALAQLDQGLSPERSAELLEQAPPRYREVVARWASGPDAEAVLTRLARSDPSSAVRAQAVTRLVVLGGKDAVDGAARALSDPDREVRRAALEGLASLGDAAVPTLRQAVSSNDPEAAQAAIAALSICEAASAQAALVEIAATHPDPALRTLADIALGRPIGDTH
ncbi:MAG: HEAT repeat domain-containing protein [Deltaproteobacteria bacterium]|nr:HEAT repeat domain-containing protein [Deltaproteobacteria bacterium]